MKRPSAHSSSARSPIKKPLCREGRKIAPLLERRRLHCSPSICYIIWKIKVRLTYHNTTMLMSAKYMTQPTAIARPCSAVRCSGNNNNVYNNTRNRYSPVLSQSETLAALGSATCMQFDIWLINCLSFACCTADFLLVCRGERKQTAHKPYCWELVRCVISVKYSPHQLTALRVSENSRCVHYYIMNRGDL